MAKKKTNITKKNAIDIKRILFLVFGSLAVVSLLFIAGYLFDYLASSFTVNSSPDRFSILGIEGKISGHDGNIVTKDNTDYKKNKYSFFDTLLEKEHKKAEFDIKREEALRSHKVETPIREAEEKVQKSEEPSSLYTMQLGSFNSFEAANTLCDKYIRKGYKAYIVSVEIPGKGTLHRVRIGRFMDINKAQEFSAEFEIKEKVSAIVTSK